MYAQLGNIVFEGLIGPESFSRTNESVYAEHALIGGKPRLQKTGQALTSIDFDIKFHSMFCNPEQELRVLNTHCENGEILQLINGNGEFFGYYVVLSVSEDWRQADVNGNIIEVGVSVSLSEFSAPDKLGQKNKDAKKNAFANSANEPSKKPLTIRNQGEASSIMKSNNDIRKNINNGSASINKAKQDASKKESMLRRAQKSLKQARTALNETNRKLTEAKQQYQSTVRFKQGLVATAQYIDNAIEAAASGDIDGAIEANKQLIYAVDRSNGAASEIAGLTASKRA